jgi:hypothetical protein
MSRLECRVTNDLIHLHVTLAFHVDGGLPLRGNTRSVEYKRRFLGKLYAARCAVTLHATGYVNRVTPDVVLWHHGAHHTRDQLPMAQACSHTLI